MNVRTERQLCAALGLVAWSAAITGIVVLCCFLCGCAVSPIYTADGHIDGYVLGVPMSGAGVSTTAIGTAVGAGLTILGVPAPAAAAIGTGAVSLLTAFGYGAHQRRKGERDGWDEHALETKP